ncbi:hypothetical protein P171DRAFT_260956 [Karstenula rhodostoma CBS 690.94]|uniref:Uncharacterized protein n=1 Tax=Karstenula rhodostoma CBS 690.94 TaxID=1392251 RepID=A0A9P4PM48_9PLEO|nr:hypothetical protein P171DRAFT_260956 [Karstenula rhodostoma CBS 690.94]
MEGKCGESGQALDGTSRAWASLTERSSLLLKHSHMRRPWSNTTWRHRTSTPSCRCTLVYHARGVALPASPGSRFLLSAVSTVIILHSPDPLKRPSLRFHPIGLHGEPCRCILRRRTGIHTPRLVVRFPWGHPTRRSGESTGIETKRDLRTSAA